MYEPQLRVSAEAYDIRTKKWSPIAPPPIWNAAATSAAVGNDGRIYLLAYGSLVGGDRPSGEGFLAYDIARNTWSPHIDPPVTFSTAPRLASDAAGRIYVAGSPEVLIFDPQANTWRSAAPMPTARSWFALAPGGDGRLYAIGGDAAGTVEAYDPAQDSWAAVSPLNVPRGAHAVTMGLDGRVYVLGGEDPWSTAQLLNSVEVYQPGQAR